VAFQEPLAPSLPRGRLDVDNHLLQVLEEQDARHGQRQELVGQCRALVRGHLRVEGKPEGAVEAILPELPPDRMVHSDGGREAHDRNASHIASVQLSP
jgi:hypothetical protein